MLWVPTPGVVELAKWLLSEVSLRGLWLRLVSRLILELQVVAMTMAA